MAAPASETLSLAAQLPALQVVVPMLAAPICSLLRVRHVPWALAMLVSLICLVISLAMLVEVRAHGPMSYALGGWAPPIGIEFRVDVVNAFVLVLVSLVASFVLAFAKQSIEREIPAPTHALTYTAFLLCLTGLLGVSITGDAFNLFVFLEVSSLSTYVLVAKGADQDRRALTAAFSYLIMGTVGATFFVIGLGFLYSATGTLNMADLANRLPSVSDSRTVQVGYAFITVGLALKAAVFPLHSWLPNAYTYAPSAITTFLAATSTKVSIYALFRFQFSVFGEGFPFAVEALTTLVLPLALVAMFACSLIAILQEDLKRMLAYSSVAQVGYMLLGASMALESPAALSGAMLHVFNHALMKGAAFMALACAYYRIGRVSLTGLRGFGWRMPWTMAVFVVAGLSLIGVPGTVGFVSKWYLVLGAIEAERPVIAALIVLSSLLAVAYVWRVVEAAYFQDPAPNTPREEAPISMLLPALALAGLCIGLGLYAEPTGAVAQEAAGTLLQGIAGGGEAGLAHGSAKP